jgi:pyrroloquinoline quinone biosynthesis protein D
MTEPALPAAPLITVLSRPHLPRHIKLREDAGRNRTIILGPERIFSPNPVAIDVIQLCDGHRSVADIAGELAKAYDAPLERITRDVVTMLTDLVEKGVIRP